MRNLMFTRIDFKILKNKILNKANVLFFYYKDVINNILKTFN